MSEQRKSVAVISVTQGEGHGSETVLEELIHAWNADSIDLKVVAPRGSRVISAAGQAKIPTVELETSRDAIVRNLRALRQVSDNLRGSDLVHAWSARSFELAWWMAGTLSVPACGTLHDHARAEFHGVPRQRIMRWSANRMSGLVTVSRAVAQAAESCGYRVPLQVIHNGLKDVKRSMLPADHISVGFLGMYALWKGVKQVADWIEDPLKGRDMQWCLYGEPIPRMSSRFARLAAKHPDSVLVKGALSTEDIFNEIDVLVHASVKFDPLPTVLIEAARAGIPCVASSAGGGSEIVVHGETGFLFSPNQPGSGFEFLDRLVSDAGLREEMGQRARERYEREFRVEFMVDGYRRFWAALCQRNKQD